MEKREEAIKLHQQGFNCAQAVFSVFCDAYGISRETAAQLACGLGGGVRSGEICGAVTGAALVIGLKYGSKNPEDVEQKQACNKKTAEMVKKFREEYGTVICRELLQGEEKKGVCNRAIRSAVALLEEQGY